MSNDADQKPKLEFMRLLDMGTASLENDELFREIVIKGCGYLKLTSRELASKIQMDATTIERWVSGKTAPYPLMRKGIYRWFRREASYE